MLGLIRYSVEKPFKSLLNLPDDIFQPDYFNYRFNIFKEITLKSLYWQIYKDFKVLIYHSDKMPQELRKLFVDIEQQHPFIRNIFQPGARIEVPKEFMDDALLTFRLDNDDGLPRDITQKLSAYENKAYAGVNIVFPETIAVQKANDDEFFIEDLYYVKSPMAMAYVAKASDENICLLGDHTKIYKNFPTLMLPGAGGLMTINGENCANHLKKHYIINRCDLQSKLKELNYPEFDFDCLRSIIKPVDYHRGKTIMPKVNK